MSVTSLYLPPTLPFAVKDLEVLNRQLLNNKLILADGNSHHSAWGALRTCPRGRKLLEFTNIAGLSILNRDEPTFLSSSGWPSFIDVSLASPRLALDAEWFTHSDMLGSDHLPVCLVYPTVDLPGGPPLSYNCKKADWTLFARNATLRDPVPSLTNTCNNITESLIAAADLSIPKNDPFFKGKLKVPWWTPLCRTTLNNRNRAWRHYRHNPSQESFIVYKKAQAEARKIIRAAKRKTWREFVSRINRGTTSTEVWNTIRAIKGRRSRVGARYLRIQGRMVMNPRIIANTIGRTFQKNSSNSNSPVSFLNRKSSLESTVPNFGGGREQDYNRPFAFFELEAVLSKVKGSSAGPDMVRYEMLQNLCNSEKRKLLHFYNDVWERREVPSQWGEAIVIPILKPGKDPLDPESYRPIALTNCVCKIFERMVNNRLLFSLETKGLICPFQSGFRRKRSTLDND
ncbi:unnamed protein product, partial [Meganyctiphanes norvegica]